MNDVRLPVWWSSADAETEIRRLAEENRELRERAQRLEVGLEAACLEAQVLRERLAQHGKELP